MNIFERASRANLRFATSKGYLSTEDLWTLSLTALDSIAKNVNKELKAEAEESFISTKNSSTTELELKLEILKHIIASHISAKEAAQKAAETKAKKERIEELILQKKDKELEHKSVEELQQLMAEL